jgi:hypothetical protein
MKEPDVIDKCQRCHLKPETMKHITSGCSILATQDYIQRHDNICKQVYLALVRKHGVSLEEKPWYQMTPPPVIENDDVKLYYN